MCLLLFIFRKGLGLMIREEAVCCLLYFSINYYILEELHSLLFLQPLELLKTCGWG